MRFYSYFNTALQLIALYKGEIPLSHFLKQHFAKHKKYGGKDRKYIAHLCYCYYRLGVALKELKAEERLKIALFLCNEKPLEWAILYEESWLKNWSSSVDERIVFIQSKHVFLTTDIYPLTNELSDKIDKDLFTKSHFIQPDLFLRIRPKYEAVVISKLVAAAVPFTQKNTTCIALHNSTKADAVIALNKEAVVQDYSSQRVGGILGKINTEKQSINVWDCCAASGGKSILVVDTFPGIKLTVSDVRQSIISNLHKRFAEAGIKGYHSFVVDLTNAKAANHHALYNLVICDAPCSGSGTWGRTPEQLYFFTKEKIQHYTKLQQQITKNVLPSLKNNGYFLYITCSVFKEENEAITEQILQDKTLQLVEEKLLEGYADKADTMYAALFKKQQQ